MKDQRVTIRVFKCSIFRKEEKQNSLLFSRRVVSLKLCQGCLLKEPQSYFTSSMAPGPVRGHIDQKGLTLSFLWASRRGHNIGNGSKSAVASKDSSSLLLKSLCGSMDPCTHFFTKDHFIKGIPHAGHSSDPLHHYP